MFIVHIQIYLKKAFERHLPNLCMAMADSPARAALVAPPMQKLCDEMRPRSPRLDRQRRLKISACHGTTVSMEEQGSFSCSPNTSMQVTIEGCHGARRRGKLLVDPYPLGAPRMLK